MGHDGTMVYSLEVAEVQFIQIKVGGNTTDNYCCNWCILFSNIQIKTVIPRVFFHWRSQKKLEKPTSLRSSRWSVKLEVQGAELVYHMGGIWPPFDSIWEGGSASEVKHFGIVRPHILNSEGIYIYISWWHVTLCKCSHLKNHSFPLVTNEHRYVVTGGPERHHRLPHLALWLGHQVGRLRADLNHGEITGQKKNNMEAENDANILFFCLGSDDYSRCNYFDVWLECRFGGLIVVANSTDYSLAHEPWLSAGSNPSRRSLNILKAKLTSKNYGFISEMTIIHYHVDSCWITVFARIDVQKRVSWRSMRAPNKTKIMPNVWMSCHGKARMSSPISVVESRPSPSCGHDGVQNREPDSVSGGCSVWAPRNKRWRKQQAAWVINKQTNKQTERMASLFEMNAFIFWCLEQIQESCSQTNLFQDFSTIDRVSNCSI